MISDDVDYKFGENPVPRTGDGYEENEESRG
jgi:hypothetical protein